MVCNYLFALYYLFETILIVCLLPEDEISIQSLLLAYNHLVDELGGSRSTPGEGICFRSFLILALLLVVIVRLGILVLVP